MRVPRLRFTVRRMMVAAAVVALLLGYLRRPHPVGTALIPADAGSPTRRYEIVQEWSDGRAQYFGAILLPGGNVSTVSGKVWSRKRRHYGPVLQVEWSDGTKSYYLE